jgi:Uma2 family endonuclease
VSTQPKTFLTPEQYLEIERKAEYKSEYYAGEMFAMSGAKEAHNLVAVNLTIELGRQLRPRRCRLYPSGMRVCVSATGLYTYPDLSALCGEPRFLDDQRDTLLNPTLVIEVLSPSTEGYDRGRKFEHYRSIETLMEYLLVVPDRVHTELFRRQPDSTWVLTEASSLDAVLHLESVDCRLALSDIYDQVDAAAR